MNPTLAIVPNAQLQRLALAVVLRSPKLKSPLLGIPRPGMHPFVVSRDIVATCIKDGVVTDVVLNETLQINVKRAHGKGSYKVMPHPRTNHADTGVSNYYFRMYVVEPIHKWAAQQRRNGVLSGGERQRVSRSKYAVKIRDTKAAIAKLEARMNGRCHRWADKITKPSAPQNPLLVKPWHEGYTEPERYNCQQWHNEKPQRKRISRIKSIHRQDKTLVKFYKAMAAAGFTVRQYPKVKCIHNGRAWPEYRYYLDHIHEYARLASRPKYALQPTAAFDPKSYYESKMRYIADLRKWQSAQQELAGLRELLASYEQDAAREAATHEAS